MHTIETQNQFNTPIPIQLEYFGDSKYSYGTLNSPPIAETIEILPSIEFEKTLESNIKYLAESWVDDFEKKIFKGKTLNELLIERGI